MRAPLQHKINKGKHENHDNKEKQGKFSIGPFRKIHSNRLFIHYYRVWGVDPINNTWIIVNSRNNMLNGQKVISKLVRHDNQ